MKRLLCLLVLAASALAARTVHAQDPFGSVAAVYSYNVSKVLADPARTRVYVADSVSNSVVVIDTTTLKATATVLVGSKPVDMAISPDGNTLYVANGGSTLSAICVLDLNTLAVRATYSLVNPPVAIAAGLSNRLYVSASPDGFSTAIYQLDGTTGAVQTTFNSGYYDNNLLTLSVDGKTLYEAENEDEPGDLKSFDVSTATPAALQDNARISTFPPQLVVSHTGKYVCLPSYPSNTYLYSTADITTYYGTLISNEGSGAGPLAFSPDDSLVYQVNDDGADVDVFSTVSFAEINHVPLTGSNGGSLERPNQMVIDNTGSYLFIGSPSDDGTNTAGQLTVLTTGAGTLTPASIVPAITSSSTASGTQGMPFTYQIAATGPPTSYAATNLPAGLSVNPTTGLISGTPTGNGYSYAQISATNASGTATAQLEINIAYSSLAYLPVITTTSLPNGTVGQIYSATILATNNPYAYSASGLPNGLQINASSGVVTGTPTAAGTATVTFSATNSYGTNIATITLTVAAPALPPPIVTSGTAATDTVGTPFVYQIIATGSPTGYTATGLPAGLSVDPASGRISGTPTASGAFTVTLSAVNASGTGTGHLALTVAAQAAPVITSASTVNTVQGQAFAYQITASNTPTRYAASGLPAGLSLDPASGLITGTPTQVGIATVMLSASNSGGTGSATLALNVTPALPTVTLMATIPSVAVGSGEIGEFTLSLSEAAASDVVVNLTIKGTAVNGTDYVLLGTTKKIKAGHTSKAIKVVPLGAGPEPGTTRTVVLILTAGDGYVVGTAGKVKVKLLASGE